MPNSVKCCKMAVIYCKIEIIQIVSQIVIILSKDTNGKNFPKCPELLPLFCVE